MTLAVVALLYAAPAATASVERDSRKLRERIGIKGIVAHEQALQGIATLADGNRLAGTPGYDASALYVSDRATPAGLNVPSHPFQYQLLALADCKPPILEIVSGAEAHSFNPDIAGAIPATGGEFGTDSARSRPAGSSRGAARPP